MELPKQIESLLFIAGKPLSYKKITEIIGGGLKPADIKKQVFSLSENFKNENRGLQIIVNDDKAQMAAHKDASDIARTFSKDEMQGELSKPSIETLTIIAYRGPISKLELERIRGINCSLILRNLILRGLAAEKTDPKKHETYYSITLEFLKHLGINSVKNLPDYDKLHKNEAIDKFLAGYS